MIKTNRSIAVFLFFISSLPVEADAQGYYPSSDPYTDRANAESQRQEQDREYRQQQYDQQRQMDEMRQQQQYEANRQGQMQYDQRMQQEQRQNQMNRSNCGWGQIC